MELTHTCLKPSQKQQQFVIGSKIDLVKSVLGISENLLLLNMIVIDLTIDLSKRYN